MVAFLRNNQFFIIIFLSIVIGYICPPIYSFKVLIPILLGLSLLFSFLKMDFSTFAGGEKNWLVKSSILRFIVAPIVIYPVAKYFLAEHFLIGYVIMAIAPTGLGAVLLSSKTQYDSKIVALDVIFQNILAVVLIPVISIFLFNTGEGTFSENFTAFIPLFTRISAMIFIPLSVSALIKKFTNASLLQEINARTGKFNTFAIVSIIFVAANIAFGRLKESNESFIEPLIFAFVLATINYGIGFFITKDKNKRMMTSMSLGYRNTSLVVWIMVNFYNPIGSLPAVFYIISQHFYNINILIKSRKELK